jgi:hypothetical protein
MGAWSHRTLRAIETSDEPLPRTSRSLRRFLQKLELLSSTMPKPTNLLLLLLCCHLQGLGIRLASAQSTPAEDQPSQRWLPLPEVKRDSVGKQTELLRMLGKLMDSSLPQELGRLSPEKLARAQEKFQEWREKTGADIPGLESIPPEWIEQVTSDPQMQQRARRLLEQFSENRTIPDQQRNGSQPNLGPQEPIQNLMERFNRKQQRTEISGQPNSNRSPSREKERPSHASPSNANGRASDEAKEFESQAGQRSGNRLPAPNQSPFDNPGPLPSQQSDSGNSNERRLPAAERNARSGSGTRGEAAPGSPATQNDLLRNKLDPNWPEGNQVRDRNLQAGGDRRSDQGSQQGKAKTPSNRAKQRESDLPSSEDEIVNPFRNPNPAIPTLKDAAASETTNFGQGSDPLAPSEPSNQANEPFGTRNSDSNTPNTARRTLGDNRARNSSTRPPELTPALRKQLAELLSQLAEADALPQADSKFGRQRNDNSTPTKANTNQQSRNVRNAARNQPKYTPDRNQRLSTQTTRREDAPPSQSARDFDPSQNSVPQNRFSPSEQWDRRQLADNPPSMGPVPGAQAAGASNANNANPSASEIGEGLTEQQKNQMIDEFASDDSVLNDWTRSSDGQGSAPGKLRSSSSGLSPQRLMELAQKIQRDSKFADQIRQQLKSDPPTPSGAKSGPSRNSNLDIESQVERFGFGQTLQNIVRKTIEAEEAKKPAPSGSANTATSQNGRSSKSGSSASSDAKTNRLPSNQGLARNENQAGESRPNSNSQSTANSQSNKESTLKQIAESFWQAAKPTAQDQTSQGASSQSSSTPTGGISFSAPTFSMGNDTWIAIGIVITLIAIWFYLKQRGIAQAEVLKREVRWAKQAIKTGLNSRADVVRAYHSLVLNRTSPASKWWTHRYVQVQLAQRIPQLKEVLSELTELYEVARYAPPQQEFRTEQLDSAKAALAQLESAAA